MTVAAALFVLLRLPALNAQGRNDLIVRCQDNARIQLVSARAGVDTIWFGDAPRVGSALNDGAQVAGAGIVHDRVTRHWRRFVYSCAWRVGTAQTAVAVRVDSMAVPR